MKKLFYVPVAIIGLILVVPSFIDWSHFKAPLIEVVKTNTGYDLDVKGHVNLSLFPTPHLKAHDIFVKNKAEGKSASLLELKSVSLSLNIVPLLRGQIVIDKIELIEPIINLETSETGQNNWDIQEKTQIQATSVQGPVIKKELETSAAGSSLSLRKIIVKGGQVSFVDHKTKTRHEGKDINLEGGFDFLAQSAHNPPVKPIKQEEGRWSKEKWNFKPLQVLDANFKMSMRELLCDEYQLNHVTVTLYLKDGNLQVTSFGAEGYGGSLSGDISFLQGYALKLNFGIQKLDLSSLPKAGKTPLKKSILTTALRLNAKGDNVHDLVHSLTGDMSFNLSQGVVEAFDIKKFINDIKQVKGPGDLNAALKDLNSKAQTPFDSLKANFTVQNGKASSQDIEFSSPDITLTGKGTIDLPKWLIDMQTQVKIKELSNLPSLGLLIEGNLDSPSYKIDQTQLIKILFQEVAGRMIDKAVQGINGKVGDVLKEVFGKKQNASQKPPEPSQQQSKEPIKPEKVIKDLLKAF